MGECVKSGYRWCWENEYCYESVCAHPKIYWQFEDKEGNDVWTTYPYAKGGLYIRSGCSGNYNTNIYGFLNASSWDEIWDKFSADEYGFYVSDYDFTPPYSGGRMKIADVGETFTKCVALVAYDWNGGGPGYDWASTGAGYGFIGSGNCVSIQVIPDLPSIKETIGWEANVPSGSHTFYLFSIYGTNTNNTINGFQMDTGRYMQVNTPTDTRFDDITTPNVSKYDCLTIIAENYDGSNITGIYSAWIRNSVV